MVKRATPTRDEVFAVLDEVKDPEVPALSVVELGIVRDAAMENDTLVVTVTPTYSGCPAMHEIEADIRDALGRHGFGPIEIRTTYTPAWTTDWIGPEARAKLEAYGIAPPGVASAIELVPLRRAGASLRCPFCRSTDTEQRSAFGSTACKAIWYCRSCRQPFEEFKAI
jgi:ring-1,2-phenylacetyl-CoA epoxidase subunit PaaD